MWPDMDPLTPTPAVPRAVPLARGVSHLVTHLKSPLRPAASAVCACALLFGVQVLAEGVPEEGVNVGVGGGVGAGAMVPLAEVIEALPFL